MHASSIVGKKWMENVSIKLEIAGVKPMLHTVLKLLLNVIKKRELSGLVKRLSTKCPSSWILLNELSINYINIYTHQCDNIQKCFPKPKKPLKFQSNKNPLFSLCNERGGTLHFVKVKGFKEIFSICLKEKNKIVDLESLMNHYKTNIR
jgi:hypothetical protein